MAPVKKFLETDVENVHSLPNIEEVRTNKIIANGGNKYSGKNKRTIALVVILVAVIATAVGFSIAVTQNNRGRSSSNSLESGNDGTNGDDTNGDDGNSADDDASDITDDNETDDTERINQIISFLSDNEISALEDLRSTTKPQYKAAVWISNNDDRELDIPESINENGAFRFVERYVMAVFFYALGGEDWNHDVNFLSEDKTCDWSFNLQKNINLPGEDPPSYDYGVSCWDSEADEYSNTVTWIFMRTYEHTFTR
jgi:hypothetical protein